MPTVAILAVQNSMISSITGPLDIFSVAFLEWQRMFPTQDSPLFKATVVAPANRHITAFGGSRIPIEAFLNRSTIYDIVLVPVIFGDLEKLFEGTTETVEVITLKTGYGDTSSFRKHFKKYTGLSPSL